MTQIALVVLWLAVTQEEIIIVAGGFNKGQILKSTEMLRYGEWEAGPNLPKKLYGHSVIGFEKDLYVLGQGLLITDERNSCKWTYHLVELSKSFIMVKISGQKFRKILSNG